MDPQILVGAAGAPVVVALVQVFVKPFFADHRIYPVAAVMFGLVLNLVAAYLLGQPLGEAGVTGLLSGLAASGAYSAVQTMGEGGN